MTTRAKSKHKEHTIVYYEAFGYDLEDQTQWVPSEIDDDTAVDIHHIDGRANRIENLMALTRSQHIHHGERKESYFFLYSTHYNFMIDKGIDFDYDYMESQMLKYSEL